MDIIRCPVFGWPMPKAGPAQRDHRADVAKAGRPRPLRCSSASRQRRPPDRLFERAGDHRRSRPVSLPLSAESAARTRSDGEPGPGTGGDEPGQRCRDVEWLPAAGGLGSHVVDCSRPMRRGEASQRFHLTVLESLPNQAPYVTSSPPRAAIVINRVLSGPGVRSRVRDAEPSAWPRHRRSMQVEGFSCELSWPARRHAGQRDSRSAWSPIRRSGGRTCHSIRRTGIQRDHVLPVSSERGRCRTKPTNHLFIASDADGDR